jgi:hypothetical protein
MNGVIHRVHPLCTINSKFLLISEQQRSHKYQSYIFLPILTSNKYEAINNFATFYKSSLVDTSM